MKYDNRVKILFLLGHLRLSCSDLKLTVNYKILYTLVINKYIAQFILISL